MMKQGLLVALFGLCVSASALADELVLPREELLRQGYRPVAAATKIGPVEPPRFAPHSLRWPVAFEDERHTIGNVMSQYQNYGSGAYYHGGDDLRCARGTWIYAPIAGRLEAGHYGYDTLPNGQNKKYWMPWPQRGNAMYFEVAIIDNQGYRFELHHVDRSTLTPEIVALLNGGGGLVQAGQKLGQIVTWGNSDTDSTIYNHTHYNIISPDGVNLNPEHYSVAIPDTIPPVIEGVYPSSDEIVVIAYDKLGSNIYTHTPAYTRLVFESGAETVWDFRERLTDAKGAFPPIWDFLREELTLPNGDTAETQGDYWSRKFLLRLKVPGGAHGKYRVEIGDSAGNVSARTGTVATQ